MSLYLLSSFTIDAAEARRSCCSDRNTQRRKHAMYTENQTTQKSITMLSSFTEKNALIIRAKTLSETVPFNNALILFNIYRLTYYCAAFLIIDTMQVPKFLFSRKKRLIECRRVSDHQSHSFSFFYDAAREVAHLYSGQSHPRCCKAITEQSRH